MEKEVNDNRVVESGNEHMEVFCNNFDVSESNESLLLFKESENFVGKQHNDRDEFEPSVEEDLNINRIGNKRQVIADSDSEDFDKNSSSGKLFEVYQEKSQCIEHIISVTGLENHSVSQIAVETKKKSKRWAILDSDSDLGEEESTFGPESHSYEVSKSHESLVNTDHNGKIVPENSVHEKSRWTALCDSDSDDDYHETEIGNDNNENALEDKMINPTPYKKKNRCKTTEKTSNVKMTGKEAAKQRREIQSESQRMVREMNVSLPYHRPKSFTLKEFLSRKTKISSAIPVPAGTSPSVAIKMSKQQLEIISKKLKQHEKEVKEFYKSESESGDEDTNNEDYVPPGMEKTTGSKEISHSETKSVDDSEKISLEENKNDEMAEDSGVDTQQIDFNSEKICTEENKNDEMAEDSGVDTQQTDFKQTEEVVEESSIEVNDKSVEKNDDISIETIQKESQLDDSVMHVNNSSVNNHIDGEMTQKPTEIQQECESSEQPSRTLNESEEICTIDDTENRENQIYHDNGESADKSGIIFEKLREPQTVDQNSMEYEFNLDDIDQSSEKCSSVAKVDPIEKDLTTNNHNEDEHIIESTSNNGKKNIFQPVDSDTEHLNSIELSQDLFVDSTTNKPKSFEYSDLDREIENFTNIENSVQTGKPTLSKLELLREKLANIKPRLSGGENEIIDLNTEIARPNEVTKLMQRFVQHTTKINSHKSKVKLNIVSVESGEIFKETVDMNVDDDDPVDIEEKPGAKLQKLRGELQNRMSEQRKKMWQKKINAEPTSADKDPYDGEKSDCESGDRILDDDEEEEMSESSEEENEEEEEENEQKDKQKDKHQAKSSFFNNETEETDREDSEEDCIEADDGDDEQEMDEEEKSKVLEDEESNSSDHCEGKPVKKTLKRILKGFTEDSDEDDQFDLTSQNDATKAVENLNQNKEAEATHDDYLPSHQPQNVKTPVRHPAVSQSTSEYDFLTPVSYITGLNNLNSASKSKSFGVVSPFRMPNVPSPLKEANWHANLQKKLFTHSEITNSQAEAIAELCSDNASFSQEPDNENTNQELEKLCSSPVNTQDILNICSGEFTDNSQAVPSSASPTSQDLLNICSGEFTGVSQDVSHEAIQTPLETHTFNPTKEVKSLGADEGLIISQLLDEDMEKFKKTFESPLMTNTQRRIVEEFEENAASGRVIDSDDDEGDGLEIKKKVHQKKLIFSDESSDDEENEEVIDLHDEVEEDDNDEEIIPADNIGYDSEENEIEYISDKGKLADFFDKEAELSESEWGSADEDEKDLDTMEFEQGDIEKFDEKKIRSDLEKIHMRRMLDDDTREVKLLQELLLEDGELHGTGRERQFRWKNIDSVDDTEGGNKEDNDVCYLDEEESEEQWRKKRHEIEMFLKEKQLKSSISDEFDLLSDSQSQLLKTGHKVIQNSSQVSVPDSKPTVKSNSPDIKSTFSFMNKRGSFLSRNDQVLQRLADYNKQTNTAVNSVKNSRNFLFQTVTGAETTVTSVEKKRKAIGGTPRVIKKLRLSDNMSPAVGRKKKIDQPSAKAKLFVQ
nr:claspin-like isoform X2 [Leptinotarsa decemlineata]